MAQEKRKHAAVKSQLHPRNPHRKRYDFEVLVKSYPPLEPFVQENPYGDLSVDFFDPEAVKQLNTALLYHFYGITSWAIPEGYLCPPIPGRADYVHVMADLLADSTKSSIPVGNKVRVLDLGVGANCVYPIIGNFAYSWAFVGSEIDPIAVESAQKIVEENPGLKADVEIRAQRKPGNFFKGVIRNKEIFDLVMCNPPFHASAEEAHAALQRKVNNLKGKRVENPVANFGGQNQELWCEGGEKKFIREMIAESVHFKEKCLWFTTLVSKESSLPAIYGMFDEVSPVNVQTIQLGQGNKTSRVVAWTFIKGKYRKLWAEDRWK